MLSDNAQNAMESLSVETFGNRVEQLYQQVCKEYANMEKIPMPVLPLVLGARAASRISHIPAHLVRRSMSYSSQLAEKLLLKNHSD